MYQSEISSLNIEFNFDKGACKKITLNFEERPSLANKFA